MVPLVKPLADAVIVAVPAAPFAVRVIVARPLESVITVTEVPVWPW